MQKQKNGNGNISKIVVETRREISRSDLNWDKFINIVIGRKTRRRLRDKLQENRYNNVEYISGK